MKISLHGFIDIFMEIDVYVSTRKRTEPIKIDVDTGRMRKARLVIDETKKFVAKEIRIEDDLIVYEANFMDFIELLNCFTSNLLEVDREYELTYKKFGGYIAKIVSKEKEKYLGIITAESKKEIFLSKYDCKVIVSNFNKIYSKCIRSEFA
jgi:hypothetical protein